MPVQPIRPLAELTGTFTQCASEGAAERFRALKPGIKRNIDNLILRIKRQPPGSPAQAQPLNIAIQRLAAEGQKLAMETMRRFRYLQSLKLHWS